MRLAPAAELAVRGMLILAENYGKDPVPIATICEQRGMGKEYLTKIFSSLSKAGLVTPIRGKGGGYTLSRPPKDISILEIIEAVEGPVFLNYCQHDPPQCDQTGCPLRDMWGGLQDTVRKTLASHNLADCVIAQDGRI
jgi:Rrf2 family protein